MNHQAIIQHIFHEGEDAQIPHLDFCFVDNPWPVACHLSNIFLAVDEANIYSTIVRWAKDRNILETITEMLVHVGIAVLG